MPFRVRIGMKRTPTILHTRNGVTCHQGLPLLLLRLLLLTVLQAATSRSNAAVAAVRTRRTAGSSTAASELGKSVASDSHLTRSTVDWPKNGSSTPQSAGDRSNYKAIAAGHGRPAVVCKRACALDFLA
jgi:hypothetical protein